MKSEDEEWLNSLRHACEMPYVKSGPIGFLIHLLDETRAQVALMNTIADDARAERDQLRAQVAAICRCGDGFTADATCVNCSLVDRIEARDEGAAEAQAKLDEARASLTELKTAGDILCDLHLQECSDEPCRWASVWRNAKAHASLVSLVSNSPESPPPEQSCVLPDKSRIP